MNAIAVGGQSAVRAVVRLPGVVGLAEGSGMTMTGLMIRLSGDRVRIQGKEKRGEKGQRLAHPCYSSHYAARQIHRHLCPGLMRLTG